MAINDIDVHDYLHGVIESAQQSHLHPHASAAAAEQPPPQQQISYLQDVAGAYSHHIHEQSHHAAALEQPHWGSSTDVAAVSTPVDTLSNNTAAYNPYNAYGHEYYTHTSHNDDKNTAYPSSYEYVDNELENSDVPLHEHPAIAAAYRRMQQDLGDVSSSSAAVSAPRPRPHWSARAAAGSDLYEPLPASTYAVLPTAHGHELALPYGQELVAQVQSQQFAPPLLQQSEMKQEQVAYSMQTRQAPHLHTPQTIVPQQHMQSMAPIASSTNADASLGPLQQDIVIKPQLQAHYEPPRDNDHQYIDGYGNNNSIDNDELPSPRAVRERSLPKREHARASASRDRSHHHHRSERSRSRSRQSSRPYDRHSPRERPRSRSLSRPLDRPRDRSQAWMYEQPQDRFQSSQSRSPPRRPTRDDNDSRGRSRGKRARSRSRSPPPVKRHEASTPRPRPSSDHHSRDDDRGNVRGHDRDKKTPADRYALSTAECDALRPSLYDDGDAAASRLRHAVYMLIPSSAFGCIVGERGRGIGRLISQSRCNDISIRLTDALALDTNACDVVRLEGSAASICLAQHIVIERIRKTEIEKRNPLYLDLTGNSASDVLMPLTDNHMDRSPPSPSQEDGSIQWLIPSNLAGKMMGQSGSTISHITRRNSTRVKVTPLVDMPFGSTERCVTITGSDPARIEETRAAIEELVGGRLKPHLGSSGRGGQRFAFPWYCASTLIGPRGATIHRITGACGARVMLAPTEDLPIGCLNKSLHIQGTTRQIKGAYAAVRDVIRKDLATRAKMSHDAIVSFKLVFHKKVALMLLSNSGRCVREIVDRSHAYVWVQPANPTNVRIVVVSGSLARVLHAQRILLDMMATNELHLNARYDEMKYIDMPLVGSGRRARAEAPARREHMSRLEVPERGRRSEREALTAADELPANDDRAQHRSTSSDDRHMRRVSRSPARLSSSLSLSNRTVVEVETPAAAAEIKSESITVESKTAHFEGSEGAKVAATAPSSEPDVLDRLTAPLQSSRPSTTADKRNWR